MANKSPKSKESYSQDEIIQEVINIFTAWSKLRPEGVGIFDVTLQQRQAAQILWGEANSAIKPEATAETKSGFIIKIIGILNSPDAQKGLEKSLLDTLNKRIAPMILESDLQHKIKYKPPGTG